MKIHKLWAENVKGISDLLEIELSPSGLNIVTAPNEMGKTTLAQVLDYLFQYKSSANSQEIKDLKPYGKDVGPLMGAIIEVDGQTYKIEKQWLKEIKTEVELLAPEIKKLSGNDAEKIIKAIFTEYLDETIWKMIQVAQANFSELLDKNYDDTRRAALSDYLAQAVVDAGGFDDANFVEKVEGHYLDWWQQKNKKLTTAKETSGSLIDQKTSELTALRATVADLEGKIADAANVEEEIIIKKES